MDNKKQNMYGVTTKEELSFSDKTPGEMLKNLSSGNLKYNLASKVRISAGGQGEVF